MSGGSRVLTLREAVTTTLHQEMKRSRDVVVMGETVRDGGAAGVTAGLHASFGPEQVLETPVSENAIFGAALGMSLRGLVPVVEIYSADFLFAVANEVLNDIPKWRQQQARHQPLPLVIRGCMGANGGLGPEHSQCMESYLHHAPGLTVVVPSTPRDAAGMLRSAVRGTEPVVFLEHRRLYDTVGEVPDDPDFQVPIGAAEHRQRGTDLTLVAWAWMRHEAEVATAELRDRGIGVDLIDPRTIAPMDLDAVVASASRSRRLLVVEESPRTGSVSAEIMAGVVERLPGTRVARLTMPHVIHPYDADLEAELIPTSSDIVARAVDLVTDSPHHHPNRETEEQPDD